MGVSKGLLSARGHHKLDVWYRLKMERWSDNGLKFMNINTPQSGHVCLSMHRERLGFAGAQCSSSWLSSLVKANLWSTQFNSAVSVICIHMKNVKIPLTARIVTVGTGVSLTSSCYDAASCCLSTNRSLCALLHNSMLMKIRWRNYKRHYTIVAIWETYKRCRDLKLKVPFFSSFIVYWLSLRIKSFHS